MFGWFKKQRGKEHDKLLHQNYAAAGFLMTFFQREQDQAILQHLQIIRDTAVQIRKSVPDAHEIPAALIPSLLEQNSDLRQMYQHEMTEGVEARMKRMMSVNFNPLKFDERFKSIW